MRVHTKSTRFGDAFVLSAKYGFCRTFKVPKTRRVSTKNSKSILVYVGKGDFIAHDKCVKR